MDDIKVVHIEKKKSHSANNSTLRDIPSRSYSIILHVGLCSLSSFFPFLPPEKHLKCKQAGATKEPPTHICCL